VFLYYEMTEITNSQLAPRNPAVLIILDGVGIAQSARNLLHTAHTPNLDVLFSKHPHTVIEASGAAVGLPEGQMGNSEVGHMTIGAGSVIKQDLVLINDAIEDESFYNNAVLCNTINRAVQKDKPIHLLGLVSDGGVHSHINHLIALISMCEQYSVTPVLHMITDGRDTDPQSALKYLEVLEPHLKQAGGYIASIMGRYYAMDRDQRWDRTERAWRTMLLANGEKANSAREAIQNAYAAGYHDEFIKPTSLPKHLPLGDDDEIIFFNFRKDRPRQIVEAIATREFSQFDRGNSAIPVMTCFMPYDKTHPFAYAFEPQKPTIPLAQVISQAGLKQFHCAETEKYAHVTYFFNGGRSEPYSGETQLLIPSPDVATYDLKPEMSAHEVGDSVIHAINTKRYSFVVVNFANGDMVGHTANKRAILHAIEALDKQVRRVVNAAEKNGYSTIITADHGNCETYIDDKTKSPHTAHTNNPVPFVVIDKQNWVLGTNGSLANIAPTVLEIMGLEIPDAMCSSSLLIEAIPEKTDSHEIDGVA